MKRKQKPTPNDTPNNVPYKPNPPELDGVPDMTSLLYLEELNILHNLNIRFKNKTVYTSVGSILISMNPYEYFDSKYGPSVIKSYQQGSNTEPHCYQISGRAYDHMKRDDKSQAIIVCGESGSGKTETGKTCMQMLSEIGAPIDTTCSNIDKRIMAVNPILESFGNAKTMMNNNSSRFGKFTKIVFSSFDVSDEASGRILGARLESYLLEKSRVIMQEVGERNFHIFYLCFERSEAEDAEFKELSCTSKKDFRYLSLSSEHARFHSIEGVDEKRNYGKLLEGLNTLGIDAINQRDMFRLVAAILHLGNVEFVAGKGDKEDVSAIDAKSAKHVTVAARLMGLEEEDLKYRLTVKDLMVMREMIASPLSTTQARQNRDSMAKSLYSAIFDQLFDQCNRLFASEQKRDFDLDTSRYIGILDVFGFECFERNSFEQFCINFANERLQQLFAESLIICEQNEYMAEGVFWVPLNIPNNDAILDLISSTPNGIFAQLEAACNMPKGTVDIFVSNVFSGQKKNVKLKRVKMNAAVKKTLGLKSGEVFNGFMVHHYAADVIYNCSEFLSKNKDLVSQQTSEMFSKSKMPILLEMFPPSPSGNKLKRKGGGARKNIGTVFVSQLNRLINEFEQTDCHFIRCINPNKEKSNTKWDVDHVTDQLRCAGLVEAVKVMKLGYPTRIAYTILEENYRQMISHPIIDGLESKSFQRAVLIGFGFMPHSYEFGFSKIFFKPGVPFIENIKKQNGPLNETQVKRIKSYFISKRFTRLRGITISFLRLRVLNRVLLTKRVIAGPICIVAAFFESCSEIRKKIAFEKAEAERLERERLERERIERERLEAIARAEREEAERRRLSLERKERLAREEAEERERLIREEEERQRQEEERIRLEKERKEREEAEERERLRREEEERIRLEEEKKRLAEEAERKRIAEMSAVELIFPDRDLEQEPDHDGFILRLKNDLARFLHTSNQRYEIALSAGSVRADVRMLEPTDEEQQILEEQRKQAMKEAIIDASLPAVPEVPLNFGANDSIENSVSSKNSIPSLSVTPASNSHIKTTTLLSPPPPPTSTLGPPPPVPLSPMLSSAEEGEEQANLNLNPVPSLNESQEEEKELQSQEPDSPTHLSTQTSSTNVTRPSSCTTDSQYSDTRPEITIDRTSRTSVSVLTKEDNRRHSVMHIVILDCRSLARKLRDADLSTAHEESLLREVGQRIGRNCDVEVPKEVKEEKKKEEEKKVSKASSKTELTQLSRSFASKVSKPSPGLSLVSLRDRVLGREKKPDFNNIYERLFLFSLSAQTDHLSPFYVGKEHGAEFFQRILRKECEDNPILLEDDNCIIIKSPETRTDVTLLIIPREPLRKIANGIVSQDDAVRFQEICKFGLKSAYEKQLSIDMKSGVILDHDTSNQHVVRIMEFDPQRIGKQIVHDIVEDQQDWRSQLINETLLCYSKTGQPRLNSICEHIYKGSNKCAELTKILINQSTSLAQKHATVNVFQMLHDYCYFESPLKYGLFGNLEQLLVSIDTVPPVGGSRKLFNRLDNGDLDLEFQGTWHHQARHVLKVLVFASYYAKNNHWVTVTNHNFFTKICEILKLQVQGGHVRSDPTVNSIMIITAGLTRPKPDIRDKLCNQLVECGIFGVLRAILLPTSHRYYSQAFAMRVAVIIRLIINFIKERDCLRMLKPLQFVFNDFIQNTPPAQAVKSEDKAELNLHEFGVEMLQMISNGGKKINKKKLKSKKVKSSSNRRKSSALDAENSRVSLTERKETCLGDETNAKKPKKKPSKFMGFFKKKK